MKLNELTGKKPDGNKDDAPKEPLTEAQRQRRKKMWRGLIGDMGETRKDTLIQSPEVKYKDLYQKTRQHREELGLSFKEYLDRYVPEEVKEMRNQILLGDLAEQSMRYHDKFIGTTQEVLVESAAKRGEKSEN